MTPNIQNIHTKLRRLRALDPQYKIFGASTHRYKFKEPLSGTVIAEFERKHQIVLPLDYRDYLLELGNGGAGPFYGIFPFRHWDDGTWEEGDGLVGCLSAPFPHRRSWNLPNDRFRGPESFDSDESEDSWHEALDAEYYDSALMNGAFPICHHGCALRTWLVVTGPERGHVWYDGRAEYAGVSPHQDERDNRLTFRNWYERWLDNSLRELGSP